MSELLPLHLSLHGRRVLVAGGGPVAARKVAAVLDAGADVLVVAPFACESIVDGAAAGLLTWRCGEYRVDDLDGAWLVFAATGDRPADETVAADAEARQVFCVRADDAATGSARSAAVVRRDDVLVSVGSAGAADPRRAVAVRDAIAASLDAGALPVRRQRPGPGRVVLVGGGPGDGDLLTLRGRRELAAADVVVVDRLAPRSVLDELGPGVLILDVGKAPGRHPVPQTEINRLLVEHAQAGRRVVRLKGGDPFVLGRGGEEVAACREAGVDVSVVPGVTSAFAVPAAAGIPVTNRGQSRQVTVISGHDAVTPDGLPVDLDWAALARGHGTLVVLMGVAALPVIAAGLLGAGLDPATPVAIVENGWTPAQRVTAGRLDEIAELARGAGVESPAVIVIGAVAGHAQA
ncbi:uroporphyrinogen-III C-methyltransferase [Nakamurella sp.]|uniref:uroporphyrinogen-III C-methyltransferase n=1 Tax=Nakamurella sp. TaxID=1869182 RepID=UPI0037844E64